MSRLRQAAALSSLALAVLLPSAAAAAPADAATPPDCNISDGDTRFVISGDTTVERGEAAGDVIVFDGDVAIRGAVEADVFVASGDITISGCVGGDVNAVTGKTTLLRGATVGGDVIYSDQRPLITPGSEVDGQVIEEDWDDLGDAPWAIIGAAALWIAVSISLLVAGITLVAVFPRPAEAAYEAVRSQGWLTVAMGLAALIGLPLVIGLAFVTLVGIPLAIVLGLAYVPVAAIGYLTCCFVVGRAVTNEGVHPILAFLAGLGILRAIALIPIAGGLAWIPAVIVGLGALIVAAMPSTAKAKPVKA